MLQPNSMRNIYKQSTEKTPKLLAWLRASDVIDTKKDLNPTSNVNCV